VSTCKKALCQARRLLVLAQERLAHQVTGHYGARTARSSPRTHTTKEGSAARANALTCACTRGRVLPRKFPLRPRQRPQAVARRDRCNQTGLMARPYGAERARGSPTMRSAFIMGGRVSRMPLSGPLAMFLKWRSRVVRNLTLSRASAANFVSSASCGKVEGEGGGHG